MTALETHKIELRHSGPIGEVSPEFLQGMLNRMAVSYHKYGKVADNLKHAGNPNGKIDSIACALQRIAEYEKTGNTEFLMDAANFCMMRWQHPLADDEFRATDSDESPGLTTVDGSVVTGTKPIAPVFASRPRRDGD